ncbi:Putative membrane protein [Amycolatopsis japonica]|uniref:Putative membrane protein n=1 Tax=Amycolatopsis japonica TaxID=208439 RepID=A0A075V6C6_9PSEU|nr:hypothetical protein [Amycolatopsis japonica]AIG78475.1 Putative membrane protein [Amycolatopsis japonica]
MNKLGEYAKAILALVFGLSPAAVVGVLALFGVSLDEATVTAVLVGLSPLVAALGVAVGPANKPKTPKTAGELDPSAALFDSWYEKNA